jgi:hypothetical protein
MTKREYEQWNCGKCGQPADYFIEVTKWRKPKGKDYPEALDSDNTANGKWWCLRCSIIEAIKPYGSFVRFLADDREIYNKD